MLSITEAEGAEGEEGGTTRRLGGAATPFGVAFGGTEGAGCAIEEGLADGLALVLCPKSSLAARTLITPPPAGRSVVTLNELLIGGLDRAGTPVDRGGFTCEPEGDERREGGGPPNGHGPVGRQASAGDPGTATDTGDSPTVPSVPPDPAAERSTTVEALRGPGLVGSTVGAECRRHQGSGDSLASFDREPRVPAAE